MLPEYKRNGSAIIELSSANKPLKIVTASFTTFSPKHTDINVWSAPDKDIVKLDLVTSACSVKLEKPNIKSLAK